MNRTDEEVQKDMVEIDNETVAKACELLRGKGARMSMYLAEIVASICDVKAEDMLKDRKHLVNAQARWLYWYAYRYMTKESYESMSKRSGVWQHFAPSCIGGSIVKMTMMIDNERIWKKRWIIVKRVITKMLDTETISDEIIGNPTFEIVVTHPNGTDVRVITNKKENK